jgi:sigma-B regulation protein RsbU (phosphoserine phosphatase)
MAHQERLQAKIRQRDFKLNALLDITRAINANLPVGELLAQFEKVLREQLSIEKVVLFTRDDDRWRSLMQYGVGEGSLPDFSDTSIFSGKGEVRLQTSEGQEAFDLAIPVTNEGEAIAFILVGDVGEQEIRISPVIKHMRFIQTITNVLVVAIENRKLQQERVKQAQVKRELELAAEMQSILLPGKLPKNAHYDVSAIYKAHQQVGGDYYDFLELNEEEVLFCMADVSGKGVSAAFLMANFQAYLRALFTYSDLDLEKAVRELNEQVMHTAMGEKYITLFIARYNRVTRMMEYINCGHNPPVMADPHGYTQLLKLGTIGLGMFEELTKLSKGHIHVPPGSSVVCYTDGLVELEDERCEQFGVERLEQLMLAFPQSDAAHLNEIIIQSIHEFKGDLPFVDDLALLTCRFL